MIKKILKPDNEDSLSDNSWTGPATPLFSLFYDFLDASFPLPPPLEGHILSLAVSICLIRAPFCLLSLFVHLTAPWIVVEGRQLEKLFEGFQGGPTLGTMLNREE